MVVILASCGSSPKIESIFGSEEIKSTETGFLQWQFTNCDQVKVVGLDQAFSPTDIAYVRPKVTTTYKIFGWRGADTISGTWTIKVSNPVVSNSEAIATNDEILLAPTIQQKPETKNNEQAQKNNDEKSEQITKEPELKIDSASKIVEEKVVTPKESKSEDSVKKLEQNPTKSEDDLRGSIIPQKNSPATNEESQSELHPRSATKLSAENQRNSTKESHSDTKSNILTEKPSEKQSKNEESRTKSKNSEEKVAEILPKTADSVSVAMKDTAISATPSEKIIIESPKRTNLALSESNHTSEYLSGMSPEFHSDGLNNAHVKIMRVTKNPSEVSAVAIDEKGNFMPEIKQWTAQLNVPQMNRSFNLTPSESNEVSSSMPSNLCLALCVDYTAPASNYTSLIENSCRSFFSTIANDDETAFIAFDHKIASTFFDVTGATAKRTYQSGTLTNFGGLTALYRALYRSISIVKNSPRQSRAIVLISTSSDDASLIYTINDVATTAQKAGIAVYTIALDDASDTYALRYLSIMTGGRFYDLTNGESEHLPDVLKEIAYSFKTFYRIPLAELPKNEPLAGKTQELSLSLVSDGKSFGSEKILSSIPYTPHDPPHQIMSVFAKNSFLIDANYAQQFSSLATVLKDNPSKVIELIGNSYEEGNAPAVKLLAQKRAQSARQKLIQLGVSASQIRMRSDGTSQPIYYLAKENWQQSKNRRVEIRWLDPALVPFEIIAQTVFTEDDAIKLSNEWEERGYKSYFDMCLVNKTPAFRVKLWGFSTYESAFSAKTVLQKKYGTQLSVQ